MSKKSLSERDICTKFITPAILGAGFVEHRAIRLVAESDLFLWYQASLERVDST